MAEKKRGLPKGRTNNPNGRPKGSRDKANAELKKRVQLFIDTNFDYINEDFAKLEPKDRLMFLEKLLAYVLPKARDTAEVAKDSAVAEMYNRLFK